MLKRCDFRARRKEGCELPKVLKMRRSNLSKRLRRSCSVTEALDWHRKAWKCTCFDIKLEKRVSRGPSHRGGVLTSQLARSHIDNPVSSPHSVFEPVQLPVNIYPPHLQLFSDTLTRELFLLSLRNYSVVVSWHVCKLNKFVTSDLWKPLCGDQTAAFCRRPGKEDWLVSG